MIITRNLIHNPFSSDYKIESNPNFLTLIFTFQYFSQVLTYMQAITQKSHNRNQNFRIKLKQANNDSKFTEFKLAKLTTLVLFSKPTLRKLLNHF